MARSLPFAFLLKARAENFLRGNPNLDDTRRTVRESAGVRRISLATSLYRAAMSGLITAAREVKEEGTFNYLDQAIATGT